MKFYLVYVIKSGRDRKWYVGVTEDLEAELELHHKGEIKETYGRAPFKLIYYEGYRREEDAMQRRDFYRTVPGRNQLQKQLKFYLADRKRS